MSKLSFRARALDENKPMVILKANEIPDVPDYSTINRVAPRILMEKEEECEHHLQRAICTGLVIPTPEVSVIKDVKSYQRLYSPCFKMPRQLIHRQPFAVEQDIPDYDMDSEDERFVNAQPNNCDLNFLKFEEMIDRLEKASGRTVVTLSEAKSLLNEDNDLVTPVYDYWLNKRLRTVVPLIPVVKTEYRRGPLANNPYTAFRRRTEKMQTRKNRKNDESSYEKMLRLRKDLSRTALLLELIKRREKSKKELINLNIEIFEKRFEAQDFSGQLLSEVSVNTSRPAFAPIFSNQFGFNHQNWRNRVSSIMLPQKKERQYQRSFSSLSRGGYLMSHSPEEEIEIADADKTQPNSEGMFSFKRKQGCCYLRPTTNGLGNVPWCGNDLNRGEFQFYQTALVTPCFRKIGNARRRIGRGGRVILDRFSSPSDEFRCPNKNEGSIKKVVENSIKEVLFKPKISLTSEDTLEADNEQESLPGSDSEFIAEVELVENEPLIESIEVYKRGRTWQSRCTLSYF